MAIAAMRHAKSLLHPKIKITPRILEKQDHPYSTSMLRAPHQIDLTGCIGVILKELFAVRCSHKLSWNWMTTKHSVSKGAAVLGFVGMREYLHDKLSRTQSAGWITALQKRVIICNYTVWK